MSATYRESVEGWRWDLLTPWGWLPSSGNVYERIEPLGWFRRSRAVCQVGHDHTPPHPRCSCGHHAFEHLTPTIADRLGAFDGLRDQWLADGSIPDPELLVITLSRVRLRRTLPGVWLEDGDLLRSHPDAVPDPPFTVRGWRLTYLEVLVDRDWPSLEGGWPAEVMPEDGVHYVPDLAEWVHARCADDLDRYIDEALSSLEGPR